MARRSRRKGQRPPDFDYQRYLASREWGVLKRAVRLRAALGMECWVDDAYCERCQHNRMYAVHHLTYERIGREDLDDLVGLCKGCHAFTSGTANKDPLSDAFAQQVKEVVWAAVEMADMVRAGDWDDYHATGCMSVATGSLELIQELMARRDGIAAGKPASTYIRDPWRARRPG